MGLKIFNKTDKSIVLGFSDAQTKLELQQIEEKLDHAEAYGRIAFACPLDEQPAIDDVIQKNKQTILTPLISLDTPGKATVRVIILADPDGHEICFVDEEGFRKLSAFDPEGNKLLERYMNKEPK